MSSPTFNTSISTLLDPAGKQLNPLLRGLTPFMAFDPAGGKEMVVKGDMAAFVVGFGGRFGSETRLYLVDAQGGRWKSAQQVDVLFELAIKWRPRQIFIEENVGRGWLQENVRIHARSLSMHLPIIWVTASKFGTGKKSERIEALQTPYKYHQILHASELKGSEPERQLLSWTPEGRGLDDFPDAIALLWLGINSLTLGLGRGAIRALTKDRKPIYASTGV